jgi:hypothetical protein
MSQTLLRGTQIMPGSIPASALVASLNLPSSQLADGANFLKKDGSVAMTSSFNAGNQTIVNVANPVNPTDGANKQYVDGLVNGFKLRFAKVVSTANVTVGGLQTIDGYVTVAGDVVLLVAQSNQTQNGFWTVASGSWTRPAFWQSGSTISEGNYAIIDAEGTTYKNTKWFVTTIGNIVVDTTNVQFTQDSSGGSYTNGSGIGIAGTQISAAIGNGLAFDGSQNIAVQTIGSGLLTATGSGVGITPAPSAGNIIVANGSLNPVWVAPSGDVSVSTSGALTVNNTAGTGFLKYTNYVPNETPGGAINGTNTTFTLANTPQVGSLCLYWNGQIQEPGAGNDYTISGSTITMLFTPLSGDKLRAYYFK